MNDIYELKQKIIYFLESDNYISMSKYINLNKEKFSWDNYINGIIELADESKIHILILN